MVPKDKYDLSALECVMLAGSPVSPEVYAWFYRNVKRDLWLHVGSGGTDVCAGFTGGSPTLPTYAGEHQHRNLGVAAYAFNDAGEAVVDEVGEMVITKPLPSMPVKFWGDDADMTRYKGTYFDEWPGVWRQGDFFKVTPRGGTFVLGRSRNVKRDLWLHVGSGGTDVCAGFTGGSPTLPTYAGEHQHRNLGVAAYAFNDAGEVVVDEVGEMVITRPMPSMPVKFWGDDADMTRYKGTYFDEWPGVWRQGDFFKVTPRGGTFVLGRSDATLNRFGVRIGTAEIYNVIEGIREVDDAIVVNLDLPGGQFFMPMFVKLADGLTLDDTIIGEIKARLRREYTPRHVPDRFIQVPAIPTTLTGKKLEVPVRRLLMGVPLEKAANTSAMADPSALDAFIDYAHTQHDYKM